MSLDVDLTGQTTEVECVCACCENRHTRKQTETFFSGNITHNLCEMAEAAGIYLHLWRPEEIGITKAAELVEPLRAGLVLLESDPPRFEKHNAENGWGTYKHFVPFVREYLQACEAHPDANVFACR